MNNGGLYKNVKMTLGTANFMVIAAIALLVVCFCIAVFSAEKTPVNTAEEIQTMTEIDAN